MLRICCCAYRVVLLAALLTGVAGELAAQPRNNDWPRWRGANFDGTATTGKNVFAKPFSLRVRWKKSIGSGYSGVVVAEGHAITMASDGKTDYLISLSSDTGKENWRLALAAAFPGKDGATSGPVSTPAIDAGVAYGLGPFGELVAVQLKTGKELWRRQIAKELEAVVPHWGFTTSPLVTGDVVLVMTGGSPDKAVTAFNKRTGATVWRSGSDLVNYASPVLAQLGGKQVVLWGGDTVMAALDPSDGKELWRYEHGGGGFFARIMNPVRVRPEEYLVTYKPDGAVLLRTSAMAKPLPGWSTRELKGNYSTPIVQGSYIFGYSGAFLSCVDATTGALAWRSRTPGDGWPIVVDGHLVVVTKQGLLAIAEASPQGYQEKAALEVFSRLVWTPPSFAEGRIYARDSYAEIAAVDIVPSGGTAAPVSIAKAGVASPGTLPGSQFARWVAEVEGKPDTAARAKEYLATQNGFPIIEGERYAHIVYEGDENDVVVRGDMLELSQDLPLRRIAGTNVHYASFELTPDARIAYQFAKNHGQSFVDPKNALQAEAFNLAGPTSLLLMPRAAHTLPVSATSLRGRIVTLELQTPTVRAETLTWGGKKKINVYLPPGYEEEAARRYPTLYVFYGTQMLNAHLAAVLDRAIGPTLQPFITVFVESTNAYEYARTFREVHVRWTAEQLVPWIDGQFRTAADPAQRTILGGDEGGFGALETVLSYPKVFGNAIAQSALPLSAGDRELLALVDRAANKTQRFYLDWGRYDGRRVSDQVDIAGFTKSVRDRMQAKGYRVSGREFPDGSAIPFFTERVLPALRDLFPRE